MKRLPHVKNLKRLNILSSPTRVAELNDKIDAEVYADTWLLEAEKLKTKRLRRFRQQMAS
ncbi:hypothetical protein JNM87_03935 [Candidatus Saccharibacteria bacterium]|nr:hypothetical protein [Candidatus Saccharibacteria bacterium]